MGPPLAFSPPTPRLADGGTLFHPDALPHRSSQPPASTGGGAQPAALSQRLGITPVASKRRTALVRHSVSMVAPKRLFFLKSKALGVIAILPLIGTSQGWQGGQPCRRADAKRLRRRVDTPFSRLCGWSRIPVGHAWPEREACCRLWCCFLVSLIPTPIVAPFFEKWTVQGHCRHSSCPSHLESCDSLSLRSAGHPLSLCSRVGDLGTLRKPGTGSPASVSRRQPIVAIAAFPSVTLL